MGAHASMKQSVERVCRAALSWRHERELGSALLPCVCTAARVRQLRTINAVLKLKLQGQHGFSGMLGWQVDKSKMTEMFSQQAEKVTFERPVEVKGVSLAYLAHALVCCCIHG